MRKTASIILCIVMALSLCCCSKKEGRKLLEKASPKTSALVLYSFDGEETTLKIVFEDQEEKFIEEINKLNAIRVDSAEIPDIKFPCYGIEINDTDGNEIELTYSNGYWLVNDGSVYMANFDFASAFKNAQADTPSTYKSGLYMPNAWYLGAKDVRFYQKADDMTNEKNGIAISFVSYKKNIVTVRLKNNTDEQYIYGEYFTLQKRIDGVWYTIPPKTDFAFNDLGYVLEPGGESEAKCDLTLYGDLGPGLYRLEKEDVVTEFEVK